MTISVIPGEISTFTVAIAILSGFILFFGYISMFLKERLFLSEACKKKKNNTTATHKWFFLHLLSLLVVAVLVGIIAGPLVTGGFDPNSWAEHDEITKQLTRCIIAIQVERKFIPLLSFVNQYIIKVMAVGIELPK